MFPEGFIPLVEVPGYAVNSDGRVANSRGLVLKMKEHAGSTGTLLNHFGEHGKWITQKKAAIAYTRGGSLEAVTSKEMRATRRPKHDERILDMFTDGKQSGEIAAVLGIHRNHVRKRLNANGVNVAAAFISKNGRTKARRSGFSSDARADSMCSEHGGKFEHGITLPKLYSRDSGVCYICGGKCDWSDRHGYVTGPEYPTIDHVVPLSKGGDHTWQNVKLAHMICNSRKGASVS